MTEAPRRFDTMLAATLDRQPKPPQPLQLGTFEWMRTMAAGYPQQAFQVRNGAAACSKPKILALTRQLGVARPDPFVQDAGMSLPCSADTLTRAGADQTSMYCRPGPPLQPAAEVVRALRRGRNRKETAQNPFAISG